jgi:hypothetical protein
MNITYGTKCSKLILATLTELLEYTIPADLHCGGMLIWENVTTGSLLQGSFKLENIGGSGTLLDWSIVKKPSWGIWVFNPTSGYDLQSGNPVTVNVSVIAPEEKNEVFSGKIRIQNKDDSEDYCTIEVKLSTPKGKSFTMHPLLQRFFENYPNLLLLLRQVLGK